MRKRYYNAESLMGALEVYEETYGLTSDEFYWRRRNGDNLEGIPRYVQHTWADFYEDAQRMRNNPVRQTSAEDRDRANRHVADVIPA